MSSCNHCSKCCWIPVGKNSNELRKCKHLILRPGGSSLCRIYQTRLGKKIATVDGVPYFCGMYNSMDAEIVGCPMNTGKKPLREVVIINRDSAEQIWLN